MSMNQLIPVNDGTRSFSQQSSEAYDNAVPISNINSTTTINITHPGHDVSQIKDSFLTLLNKLQFKSLS